MTRWHTGIVDAAGTGAVADGLWATIDGRTAAKVVEWIEQQPDSWREAVTHVNHRISVRDLPAGGHRRAAGRSGRQPTGSSLVRLANDMVTEVRQHATRYVRGRRGREQRSPSGPVDVGC